MARTNIAHSGFNDLLDLVSATSSHIGLSRFYPEQDYAPLMMGRRLSFLDLDKGKGKAVEALGVRYEQTTARPNEDPNTARATGRQDGPTRDQALRKRNDDKRVKGVVQPVVGARKGLRYRRVDKRSIGPPTDFRQVFHYPPSALADLADTSFMPPPWRRRRNCCYGGP
jgi:hypothetical protein